MLPRLPNEACTIKVILKRKLQYKSSGLSLNVRPHKVVQAAKWLINNSVLYKEEGIDFKNSVHDKSECNRQVEASNTDSETLSTFKEENWFDDSDEWSENEIESPAGVADSMLTSTNFVEDNERHYILNLAPAEGSRPLSVFRDKLSEEMAYPENDKGLTPGHYSEICRSELRRSDRKAAMCVENIFFKTKKLKMNIVLGKSQIALR